MNHREREMLASEMQQKGFNVGYIHPHYYFDAKAVHDILFYPPRQQHEIEDKDNKYYQALKEIPSMHCTVSSPVTVSLENDRAHCLSQSQTAVK